MQLFSGLFSQNQESFLNNQKKEEILKTKINELKYYTALIEYEDKFSSCFFLDLNLENNNNSERFFLCTNSHFISSKYIESKKKLIFISEPIIWMLFQ